MYKTGDKVEYLGLVWTTSEVAGQNSKGEITRFIFKDNMNVWVEENQIKPYTSAHDKLLAMGFRLKQDAKTRKVYTVLQERIELNKYEDGTWSYLISSGLLCGIELSRILLQMLEELGGIF